MAAHVPGMLPQKKSWAGPGRAPGGCVQWQYQKTLFYAVFKGGGQGREGENNQGFLNLLYHELPCLG